ncbi:hypothetical protein ABKN59_010354 [Abortiporus biennis]
MAVQGSALHLATLPPELIENALVFLAVLGAPKSVAAVAETCRAMRNLIYGSTDQHLWRELFVAYFDDFRLVNIIPRPQTDLRGASSYDNAHKTFDWLEEFRKRFILQHHIRRCSSQPLILPPSFMTVDPALRCSMNTPPYGFGKYGLQWMSRWIDILETLIFAIETARPFPPTLLLSAIRDADAHSASHPPAVKFPPPSTDFISSKPGHHFSGGNISQTRTTVVVHLSDKGYVPSANIQWIGNTLKNGLHPNLTHAISGDHLPGGTQACWDCPTETRMMRALAKLTAHVGFIPNPSPEERHTMETNTGTENAIDSEDDITEPPTSSESSSLSEGGSSDEENDRNTEQNGEELTLQDTYNGNDPLIVFPADMSIEAQSQRARRIARMRVYNLRYLAKERHWGPYLLPTDTTTNDLDDELLMLGRFAGANQQFHDNKPPPSSSKLRADWSYLAAARIVVEANIRDEYPEAAAAFGDGRTDASGMWWLDRLRVGSAPASDWASNQKLDNEESRNRDKELAARKDRQKVGRSSSQVTEEDEEEVKGTDWAGVTGEWRRCVCWMDYRDLITHNLSSQFNDPNLREATRIVPIDIRISHFTKSKVSDYPDRPNIHVVGTTQGPSGNSVRIVRGEVGMIADGNIRWILYSSSEDGPDEWVTEGIQIAHPTSAIGIIGMWTGALHESMDPLGPFWAWKLS